MNPYNSLSSNRQLVFGFISFLVLMTIWSILSGFDIVGSIKLPSPWQTGRAFLRLCWDGDSSPLLIASLWSIGRVVSGAIAVFIIGLPVGILMGASATVNAFLSPLIDPFRSAPVAALLSVLVMWFGIGETMKVIFLFLGAVVYFIPMVRDAIKSVPQDYWISAHDLGATPFEAVLKSVIPMAKPRIAEAFVAAVSIEWTYISVAEFVNAERGLGQLISNARRISAMDRVFATIIVIIALALITFQGMTWLKRRLYPWETL